MASSHTVNICQEGTVVININSPGLVTDPDGDPIDWSSLMIVSHATLGTDSYLGNGAIQYEAPSQASGDFGPDTFTYTVKDDRGAETHPAGIVNIDVNAKPVAVDEPLTGTSYNSSVVVAITGNDYDPDGSIDVSSITLMTGPLNGSVVFAGGSATYTPNPGFCGNDSFTYTVGDNNVNTCISEPSSVPINVNWVPGTCAGVMINEISTDSSNSWIEICNRGSGAVDLSGWEIEGQVLSASIQPGFCIVVDTGSLAGQVVELINGTGSVCDSVDLSSGCYAGSGSSLAVLPCGQVNGNDCLDFRWTGNDTQGDIFNSGP